MPKRATPNTRMVIPSLLSQFVPNVSSKANTDFIRCLAAGFGADERSAANCGGATTRALGGGSAITGGGGVCGVSMCGGAGGVTARGGLGTFVVAGDCAEISEATDRGGRGKLVTPSVGSGLVSPRAASTELLAAGAGGLVNITSLTAASSSGSCFTETGTESTPAAPTGTTTGLRQWSTPPPWTVPHQAQNAGRVLSAGGSGFIAAGAGLSTGWTNGSAGGGGAAGCGGFDATVGVGGCAVSSRYTAAEPDSGGSAATWRRSSSSSRCKASFC